MHFSINALTPGSVTFANDAGFIPYPNGKGNDTRTMLEYKISVGHNPNNLQWQTNKTYAGPRISNVEFEFL